MASSEKRTFSLPVEQGSYIDKKVESGSYGSASEVVRAGLRALMERDAAVEKWLLQEVVPVYDELMADPSKGIPIDEVFSSLRSEIASERVQLRKRTA